MPRHLAILIILAVTQITGWGAVGVLPVIARPVAEEFGATLPEIFLGSSVMFVAMALAAPWAGRGFRRFGTRQAMAAGAAAIGLGLLLLAAAPGLAAFWAAWALLGVAGALFLTTAAYAYLAEVAEDAARGLIGTLMLATGLASSVFWPVTAFLEHAIGWRGAAGLYGAAMLLLVAPLVRLGLPAAGAATAAPGASGMARPGKIFGLLVAAIALNSFVTFGIEALGITLLQAMGAELPAAIAIASLLGVFKVGGRVIDLLGGQRWDGLSTGLVAGGMIPLGLAAIGLGGAGWLPVGLFLLLFGLGSGAFAVARATMPLVFYSRGDYAAAMARIALPMNLINALAPPALAALLSGIGPQAVLALLGALSLGAFALLLRLRMLRGRAAGGSGYSAKR
ncbi:MFS transporter [Pseudoroseomonas deserti]|uniref:MFS transporter n=1 Tax=Teichococcus deserti TaxID=1817963 RepID=A0A1V2GVT0_9PROT|nr:MFS transporter [Pseudoroseomonas deserti]ONG46379.1 MFS transporter [Pseudoroseomonas deserti]